MFEEVVSCDEMLMAMADSLVEKQPVAFTDKLVYQDKEIKFKIGGKPPREIFYRNTQLFLTKLPPPVQAKLCSCKYLCSTKSQTPAVIKCHSCAIYDPRGQSMFCKECFDAYHPPYRVPHIYCAIEKDENIQYTLKISHRIAEANRYAVEGKDLLTDLRKETNRLKFIADDKLIEDKMGVYGRRTLVLEESIQNIRKNLHADIYGVHPPPPLLITNNNNNTEDEVLLLENGPETTTTTTSTDGDEVLLITNNVNNNIQQQLEQQQLQLPQQQLYPLYDPTLEYSDDDNDNSNNDDNYKNKHNDTSQLQCVNNNNNITDNNNNDTDNEHNSNGSVMSDSLVELSKHVRTESNVSLFTNMTWDTKNTVDHMHNSNNSFYHNYSPTTSFQHLATIHSSNGKHNNKQQLPHHVLSQNNINDIDYDITQVNEEEGNSSSSGDDNSSSALSSIDNHSQTQQQQQQRNNDYSNVKLIRQKSVIKIQSVLKGYLARKIVSLIMMSRIIRVFSMEDGRDFYFDKLSGHSSWTPPKLILKRHFDELTYTTEQQTDEVTAVKWCCKLHCKRRRIKPITNKTTASKVLTQFARCILARYRIINTANSVYRRILDVDSETYYYANITTGETSWTKPTYYLSLQPPLMETDLLESSRGSGKGSRKLNNSSGKGSGKGVTSSNSGSDRLNPIVNRLV